LYFTRASWLPRFGRVLPATTYQKLNPSFGNDIEAGFSSEAFDLNANVAAGDSRGGLDLQGKKEVLKIMKQESCSFDEARRILMEKRLAMNGIAPDGRPLDPRAVFFS
ncbi:hypothetical protein EV426DRAFT_529548, partial [Tirmania nivea]